MDRPNFEGRKVLADDWTIHVGDIIDYELAGICRVEKINHHGADPKFVLKPLFKKGTVELLGICRFIRITDITLLERPT